MSNHTKPKDATRALRTSMEIARAGKILRDANLQKNSEELLSKFESYLSSRIIQDGPDPNAVLLGFRTCWRRGDYDSIVVVGDLLNETFFADNREAHAFYTLAKSLGGK